MSHANLSPEARAVVRSLDALTTQVRRLAQAQQTPVAVIRDGVTTPLDDTQTTPRPDRESAYNAVYGYIRSIGDEMPTSRIARNAMIWPAVNAALDAYAPPVAETNEAPAVDTGGYPNEPYPADVNAARRRAGLTYPAEDVQSADRRAGIRNLLGRAAAGLTPDEDALLRQHVEAELREHDTARAVAAGNLRHVRVLVPELEQAQARVEQADAVTAETKRLMERRTTTLRRRAEIAEAELRTLRAGIRALGGDPTTIQNLWAQLRLRNRQWAEAKREVRLTRSMLEEEGGDVSVVDEMIATVAKAEQTAREAEAAIDGVRALATKLDGESPWQSDATEIAERIREAIDNAPQDREALRAKVDEATATLRRVSTVTKDWGHRVLPHSEAHRLLTEVRDALAGPRPDGPEEPTEEEPTTCTATIPDALGSAALIRCVGPAGHYDEDDEPQFRKDGEQSPGGWHTDGEGRVWSDRAATATPHGEQPTTEA
jgi:hypothetical protein